MAAAQNRLSRTRARLARRLGLRATVGLSVMGLLAGALGVVVALLVESTWSALVAGNVVMAMVAVVSFLIATALCVLVCGWLFAPVARPDGVRLPQELAEGLFRLIERTGKRFGGIRIDAVWVVGDMNAAILQRPRWGWVGPLETHLMIGLPLAHSVTRRQFGAILAHEFAHLAAQRRGLDAWWGHLRAWWFRTLDRCIEDSPCLGGALDNWTAGDLRAAIRLSRLEEFEADAGAARVVGAQRVGEALVEVALKERFLNEDYWRKIMAQSRTTPQPLIRPFREMGLGVLAGFRRPDPGPMNIHDMFGGAASEVDFHPTLAERLRVLRVDPAVPVSGGESLANTYLGPILPTLSWVFDRAWWQDSRRDWRQRYERARRA
ncbi:M48 family metallopeptidase [Aromatoleum toluclasticum]|uniref:M48 family metallopeptidase n=1 Tax=Aromatoleum toluclasticum TaxID=92003 RepID=UPI000477E0C4|nr:M48 family metallopeptidase [Aromatoleum toluclasticum]MCC4115661.1 M48 family metallopeptidase [Aromatoleum toluclasticum]